MTTTTTKHSAISTLQLLQADVNSYQNVFSESFKPNAKKTNEHMLHTDLYISTLSNASNFHQNYNQLQLT